jgi:ankyrin repeat protein
MQNREFNEKSTRVLLDHLKSGEDLNVIDTLLKNGADPNKNYEEFKGGPKFNCLHYAATYKRGKALHLLLENGADPNAPSEPQNEYPLHIAAYEADHEMCSTLIKYGANLDTTSKYGYTPLHMVVLASESGGPRGKFIDTIKALLNAGADPDIKTQRPNDDQCTALMLCAKYPLNDIVTETLLEHGANPLLKNRSGKTAMDIAKGESLEVMEKGIKKYKLENLKKKIKNGKFKTISLE